MNYNILGTKIKNLVIGDHISTLYPIFQYQTCIETISIGKNVTQIRAEAFGNCENLKSVTSYAKEPPFCYPNVFKNLREGAVLTVYASCADAYRNADTWKDFTIVTMPDPRDGMLAELETLYDEYKDYTFKAGTEEGQYGKDEVKAFNAAKFEASNILTDDSDYTDEEIQQALEDLKRSYEAVVASKVEGITIADATALSVSEEKNYQTLTYARNFKNTNWQPLYVPFSMSYEDWASQGLEVARINGFYEYDDNLDGKIDRSALEVLKVTATEGDLKPNHPYMVRATTTGEKKITINNATLHPTEQNTIDCSTVETKYTFTGTYSAIANAELSAMGAYVMGGGALGQSTSNLNPMRWYMVRESRGGQLLPALKSIKVFVYGEDEADAIDFTYDNEAEGEAYNLMGQKVSSSQKGIVIRNGKKFVK